MENRVVDIATCTRRVFWGGIQLEPARSRVDDRMLSAEILLVVDEAPSTFSPARNPPCMSRNTVNLSAPAPLPPPRSQLPRQKRAWLLILVRLGLVGTFRSRLRAGAVET